MSGAILHRYSCTITAPDVVALFVYMLCDIRFQGNPGEKFGCYHDTPNQRQGVGVENSCI